MKKHLTFAAAVFLAMALLVLPSAWAQQAQHDRDHHAEMDHQGTEMGHKGAGMSEHGAGAKGIFDSYFAIGSSLSQDSMEHVQTNAKALAEAAEKAEKEAKNNPEHSHSLHTLLGKISDAAESLTEKTDISAARAEFGTLSEKMVEYQKKHGEKDSGKLHVYRCDMAKKVWLQKNENSGNPYMGPSMAMCRRELN